MPVAITALITLAMAALADAEEQRALVPHGLSDKELWRIIARGGNPLMGMSFDRAVREDPRRIDALIRQAYYRSMHRQLPTDPMSARLDEGLYLMGIQAVRNSSGGAAPTLPLISVHEENWYTVLGGTARTWPSFVRRTLLNDWGAISASFKEARQIAHRAELSASSQGLISDAQEWGAFQEVIEDMADGLHEALVTGMAPELPGPVHARLEGRRLLR